MKIRAVWGRSFPSLVLGGVLTVLCGASGRSAEVPVLTPARLPMTIRTVCSRPRFRIRWLAQTRSAALYAVGVRGCRRPRSWIVSVRPRGTMVLLQVRHRLWVQPGADGYPVLLTTHLVRPGDLKERRYQFHGGVYQRESSVDYYRAAGAACGDAQACDRQARQALRAGQTRQAVAIWRRLGVVGIL